MEKGKFLGPWVLSTHVSKYDERHKSSQILSPDQKIEKINDGVGWGRGQLKFYSERTTGLLLESSIMISFLFTVLLKGSNNSYSMKTNSYIIFLPSYTHRKTSQKL